MTESTQGGQAPSEGQPQDGDTQQQQQPQDGNTPTGQAPDTQQPTDVDALPEWAQKLIKETRKEAAEHRTKLKQYEDAQKTELQRIQEERDAEKQRREALEQEIQRDRTMRLVESQAQALNFIDPEVAAALLKTDSLAKDEDGKVKESAVKKALEELAERKPHLVRTTRPRGSADSGSRGEPMNGSGDMNSLIRRGRQALKGG